MICILSWKIVYFQPGQQGMFPPQSGFPSQPFQSQTPTQPADPFGPIPDSQVRVHVCELEGLSLLGVLGHFFMVFWGIMYFLGFKH